MEVGHVFFLLLELFPLFFLCNSDVLLCYKIFEVRVDAVVRNYFSLHYNFLKEGIVLKLPVFGMLMPDAYSFFSGVGLKIILGLYCLNIGHI